MSFKEGETECRWMNMKRGIMEQEGLSGGEEQLMFKTFEKSAWKNLCRNFIYTYPYIKRV